MVLPSGSVAEVSLTTQAGDEIRTFADRTGHFSFADMPPGSYLMHVASSTHLFPDVRHLRRPLCMP